MDNLEFENLSERLFCFVNLCEFLDISEDKWDDQYGPVIPSHFTSKTDPSHKPYEVRRLDKTHFSCNCKGWANLRKCWHTENAAAMEDAGAPRCETKDEWNAYKASGGQTVMVLPTGGDTARSSANNTKQAAKSGGAPAKAPAKAPKTPTKAPAQPHKPVRQQPAAKPRPTKQPKRPAASFSGARAKGAALQKASGDWEWDDSKYESLNFTQKFLMQIDG